jgi:hypothetical protein
VPLEWGEEAVRKIRIHAGTVTTTATLADNETADAIWQALPVSARGNRWGDEIYLEIPVRMSQAPDARDVLEAGELGYWPLGRAFCIFFGPTPASHGDEVRAYSPVNVVGHLDADPFAFEDVPDGTEIRIDRVHESP